MATFSGTLNQNEIYSALYNMIISQEVFADRIADGSELVDKAKVDGSLYGDTKLFYATDVFHSKAWGNDSEAANLLDIARPAAPECQAVTLNVFRQIALTLDDYLSKRAFTDEAAFGQFNSVMESTINKSKRIYDVTTYNAFIGNAESSTGAQAQTVTIASNETPEGEAKKIAQKIADIFVDLNDVTRDYNDYGHVTKFGEASIKVISNSKFVNKITKVDLPQIFHKEGLVDKLTEEVLPARYFGRAVAAGDKGSGKAIGADGTYDNTKGVILRARNECYCTVSNKLYELFAGDLIPNGAVIKTSGGDFTEADVYVEDPTIICKIVVKLPPFMSGFEVGTSFWNAKSLTTNRYLTWGRNTLEYFKAYPMITVRESVSQDTIPAQHVIVDELPAEE